MGWASCSWVRAISPGLSFRDFRAISENVSGLVAITPRKRFKPQKLLPKTTNEPPQLIGVLPNFVEINSLKLNPGLQAAQGNLDLLHGRARKPAKPGP